MIEFRTKKNNTFIGIWLGGKNGNVILASGIPQYIDKYHPIIEQISRLGMNLFIPRYQGTFESSGEFSTANSEQSLIDTIDLVQSGSATELFGNSQIDWDKELTTNLLGFSYGALPTLLLPNYDCNKILICPFLNIDFHLPDSAGENVAETFEFLERAYPNMYRLIANNVMEDLKTVEYQVTDQKLTIVVGDSDSAIPTEEIEWLKKFNPKYKLITKPGGHSINMPDELFQELVIK